MSQRIVDDLESIEIEKQDRNLLVSSVRIGEGVLQSIFEQSAVGQPGQRVVVRQVLQLSLVGLLLRNVAVIPDSSSILAPRVDQRRRISVECPAVLQPDLVSALFIDVLKKVADPLEENLWILDSIKCVLSKTKVVSRFQNVIRHVKLERELPV